MGDPAPGPAATASSLRTFAARVRSRHVGSAALQAACSGALALLVPVAVLCWLVPPWRLPLLAATCGCLALAAAFAALRARRVADAVLLRSAVAGGLADARAGAELGDEFATWLELARHGEGPRGTVAAMHAWLGDDVAARVRALPVADAQALGRRSLGARLWLVPLLLLLALAWWLAVLLAPPWSGVLGGREDRPVPDASGTGPGAGGGGGASGGSGGDAPPPPPAPAPPERRDVPPPAGPEPQPEPPVAEAPLLELPTQQHFVVPEFVGDGPTRRARVHAAEVEQGAPAGTAAQRTGAAEPTPLPPPDPTRFQRAAEAALAARHVPPAERPIVRRYFDALQQAAK